VLGAALLIKKLQRELLLLIVDCSRSRYWKVPGGERSENRDRG